MTQHVLYLHGFASSPDGNKATHLGHYLAAHGRSAINYLVPDLNQPTFETLTLTAQIDHIAATVQALSTGPVYIIGSSFGGLAALHFLNRHDDTSNRVKKLILLAPALEFLPRWQSRLGTKFMGQWRERGTMPFYHHAQAQELPLHYGLVEDARNYDEATLKIDLPTRIYHGRQDESVGYESSVRFAETRPNVTLIPLESDHSLANHVDTINAGVVEFFALLGGG